MISGEQIRTARDAAGMTQQELATQLGVTLRTVGNWERGENIPRNREPLLRRILAAHLQGNGSRSPGLEDATDMELLAEVARRMARAEAKAKPASQDRAPLNLEQDDYRLAAREPDEHIGRDQMPEDT